MEGERRLTSAIEGDAPPLAEQCAREVTRRASAGGCGSELGRGRGYRRLQLGGATRRFCRGTWPPSEPTGRFGSSPVPSARVPCHRERPPRSSSATAPAMRGDSVKMKRPRAHDQQRRRVQGEGPSPPRSSSPKSPTPTMMLDDRVDDRQGRLRGRDRARVEGVLGENEAGEA